MNSPKLKRAAFALLALLVLLGCALLPKSKPIEPQERVSGILCVWDKEAMTISGSRFAFIETVCEEFSEANPRVFARMRGISAIESEAVFENIIASGTADVLPSRIGKVEVSDALLIKDPALRAQLDAECESFIPQNSATGLLVDVWYNVSVLLVNTDLLAELKLELPERLGKAELLALCQALNEKAAASEKEIFVLCAPENADNALLPLLIDIEENAKAEQYERELKTYLSPEADEYSFYRGEAALLIGNLRNVNYLLRQQAAGKPVIGWTDIGMPSDKQSYRYICEIATYAFLHSDAPRQNALAKRFAAYLHSYEVMRYTENLGMLPCVRYEQMKYERFAHLRAYEAFSGTTYTLRGQTEAAQK